MSFKSNDINNFINPGNYEEFFILYIDNELSEVQKEMVDQFLVSHPHLQEEFQSLLNTKLPLENFSFNKEELMAENMMLDAVDEELLLYIDQELTAERRKIIELELASNVDYKLQHAVLLRTKLDDTDTITYPNKKELYRRTERVVAFKVWMRIAAAIIVVAAAGVLYWTNDKTNGSGGTRTEVVKTITPAQQINDVLTSENIPKTEHQITNQKTNEQIVIIKSNDKKPALVRRNNEVANNKNNKIQEQQVPLQGVIPNKNITYSPIEKKMIISNNETLITSPDPVNKSLVTSILPERKTIIEVTSPADGPRQGDVADSKKGSFKSLLRKATRMLEKTTGIDATNDENELLIGAFTVKLD